LHFLFSNAQIPETIVEGTYHTGDVQKLILLGVKDGEKAMCATTQLSKNNHFVFTLPQLTEGFYYITDQHKNNFIRIYLKPGDKIKLNVGEEDFDLVQSTAENTILKRWTELSYPVTRISSMARKDTTTYRSFFPTLTALLPNVETFKTSVNTPNIAFNQLLKNQLMQK
jgi:hypothetical protein